MSGVKLVEPGGMGHWCSIKRTDGSWDTVTVPAASDPCPALGSGQIVGSGIFSISKHNNVVLNCAGWAEPQVRHALGTEGVTALKTTFGSTPNCIMLVQPDAIPIFNAPFPIDTASIVSRNQTSPAPFDYTNGDTSQTTFNGQDSADRYGRAGGGEVAHDRQMFQGTPIYAMEDGEVLQSWEEDFQAAEVIGTSHQSTIFVKHYVGSGPQQERFVNAYAHLRQRLVQKGWTVKKGQVIGYSGHSGASGEPHLHFNAFKLTNVPLAANLLDSSNDILDFTPRKKVAFSIAVDHWGWGYPFGANDPRMTGQWIQSSGAPINKFIDPVQGPMNATNTSDGIGRGAFSSKLWVPSQIPAHWNCPVAAPAFSLASMAPGPVQGFCDLTRELLPIPANGGPNGYTRGDGITAVVAVGNDQHVYELALSGGDTWLRNDLTMLSSNLSFLTSGSAPVASGQARGFTRADGVTSVVYQSGGRIFEISLATSSSAWLLVNLTTLSGAAATASTSPVGYVRDGKSAVVYTSSNQHVMELSLAPGGSWTATDLTASAAAWSPGTPALVQPTPYVRADGIAAVVYVAVTGHIWELSHAPGAANWAAADLSALSGTTVTADQTELAAYKRTDNTNSVVYRGTNNRLTELFLPNNAGATWGFAAFTDLMASGSAPTAFVMPGSPAKNVMAYRASNNHILQRTLQTSPNTGWTLTDLTPNSADIGDATSVHPTAFKRSDGALQVVYVGANRGTIRGVKNGANSVLAQ